MMGRKGLVDVRNSFNRAKEKKMEWIKRCITHLKIWNKKRKHMLQKEHDDRIVLFIDGDMSYENIDRILDLKSRGYYHQSKGEENEAN